MQRGGNERDLKEDTKDRLMQIVFRILICAF